MTPIGAQAVSTEVDIDEEEANVLSGLSADERARLTRAFGPGGTFDDAFHLYESVVARGEPFPVRWEARVLELGIAAFHDRDDMRERLDTLRAKQRRFKAWSRHRLPIFDALSTEEIEQATALIDETATASQAAALYSSMTAKGLGFPLGWEENHLRIYLAEDADRLDLMMRYRSVLIAQGKSVPPELELKFAKAATKEEHEADHQLAAQQYDLKTKLADAEPEFMALAEQIRPYTMTSMERMYALFKAVRYIVAADLPGAFVECGVWRGGSMMLVAKTLMALNRTDRDLFLFDTFEGLPRPDEKLDVDVWGNRMIDGWVPRQVSETSSHWAEASLEEVRANMLATGYPAECMHFVRGMVETTIPRSAPDEIALLRLDTDWYASTKHEMDHLYPRLVANGVLILDDYGHLRGAKQAIDEYFKEHCTNILLNRVDYSGRVAVKFG